MICYAPSPRYGRKFETHYVAGAMQALSLCKHCFRCTAPRKSRTTKVRRPGGFVARVDDVTVYKVSPGKVMVPTRGFSPEYKEAARSFIPCTMHRSTARLPARLHFETLSKLGNCIKSDLYLLVPGILAPRCNVTNFATQRALSSITE